MHRVLIVDRSEIVRAQLSDELASLGLAVVGSAASGAKAVSRARELGPDIVLMDIELPGDPDGIEAARIIKEKLNIPVVFLSSTTDSAVIKRARDAGADGFVPKTADCARLAAAVRAALKDTESEDDLRVILRDVVDNTNDLIYVLDGKGNFKYVNDQVRNIGGYTKEEAVGRSFASFVTPESMAEMVELFKRQAKGEDLGPFEVEIKDTSGSVRVMECRERAVWRNGKIAELHGIARDVTDRKRAEEELTAAREQYRLLVENAVEGITVIQDGVFKYANAALEKLSGYPEGGLVGLPFIDFVHPDDRQPVAETYKRIVAGQISPKPVTRRYLNRSGSVHVVENTSIPCTWEGRPAAIVLINDVTDFHLTRQLLTIQRDIGAVLSTENELTGAMEGVLERLLLVPGVDCGGIYLADEARGGLTLEVHRGISEQFAGRAQYFDANTAESMAVNTGQTIVFSRDDIQQSRDFDYLREEGLVVLVAAPVFHRGAVVGSVNIASHTEDSVSPHVISALEDISLRLGSAINRIRNQELLAESEKKYRTLIENAKEGIVVIQDGLVRYVNPTGVRISGYTMEELIGRPFEELVCPEDLARVAPRNVRKTAGEPHPEPETYRLIWKDSTPHWVEGIRIPIEWEGRRATLNFIEDITEQKRVKDALIESERKFRGVFETSRDFLYIGTIDGTILDYNTAAGGFFGYTDDEISRMNLRDLYADPDERDIFVEKVIREGFVENYELKVKKKDGTIVDALVTVVVRKDGQGNVIGLQGSVKDISRMKRLERQLLQTEKLSSLGTMISGIAHELNNPLTGIMGNAEILSQHPGLEPDVVRRLDTIFRESIRASKIIKGLLSFAREHKPERRLISLNDSIMESYKLREYDLKVSDIRVELSLSDRMRPTYADPYQIQQVFVNIINNARDALVEREGGTLTIRSRQLRDRLVVEFEDNGPGIAPDNLKRIFDPFFTTKDVGKGTGLGLSMAYGIINEHEGTIEAANAPGGGTIFTVSIPVTGVKTSAEKTAERSRDEKQAGKQILVVEDEDHLRTLFQDALTQRGYEVLAASGADEAIDLVNRCRFDGIITDIKMPGPGGVGLYRYITDVYPDLAGKMIFITGDILGKETRSFLSATDCVYLEKPFKLDDLLNALSTVLGR